MSQTRLILASASPRRKELLDQLGVNYTCVPADIDEAYRADEKPSDYVQRMAQEKARATALAYPPLGCAVMAADTIVVVAGTVLGKPIDRADALFMLTRLSNRRHSVLTAVCLLTVAGMVCELVETQVEFLPLSPAVCEAYLATDEPWDKAGAYGIQGLAGAFVRSIEGSYTNVVGLPLCETWQLLSANGIATALNAEPLD
ncbi:MAG: Maf family protein [Halioglobus sp.]|nr:Maf family protein [Halioglobus sp.]